MPLNPHANASRSALHEAKRTKPPVRAASTANVSLSSPGTTLDGVTLVSGNYLLLKDQTTASQNGIYVWTGSSAALTRRTDASASTDFLVGDMVYVSEGTVNAATTWQLTTTAAITLGTTSLAYARLGATTIPVFGASGVTHTTGLVPDPGSTAGTIKMLREDSTFAYPLLPYINIQDQKSSGTQGGTFTSGAWQTRTLNTVVTDTASLASLASNQITLPAGTYRVKIGCPGFACAENQARLQNVTGSTTLLLGSTEYAAAVTPFSQSRAMIFGRITVAASQALEVQHRCNSTRASSGFGVAGTFGNVEVFTIVEIWREA